MKKDKLYCRFNEEMLLFNLYKVDYNKIWDIACTQQWDSDWNAAEHEGAAILRDHLDDYLNTINKEVSNKHDFLCLIAWELYDCSQLENGREDDVINAIDYDHCEMRHPEDEEAIQGDVLGGYSEAVKMVYKQFLEAIKGERENESQ